MHQLCHLTACMHECLSITAMLCLNMLMYQFGFPFSCCIVCDFPLDVHSMLLACLEYIINSVFIEDAGHMAVPVCSLIQMCMCAFHRINHPVWFHVISETFQLLIKFNYYCMQSTVGSIVYVPMYACGVYESSFDPRLDSIPSISNCKSFLLPRLGPLGQTQVCHRFFDSRSQWVRVRGMTRTPVNRTKS